MSSDRRRFLREIARTAREVRGVSGAGRDALAEAREALLRGADPEPPEPDPDLPADEERIPARDPAALTDAERERYARQLALPEWSEATQLALRAASVLIVGAGALGAPVALYLAAAGVGRLGIVDDDAVALDDLQRELLHFTPDLGVPKAHSAAAKLGFLNPEVEVVPYEVRFGDENAAGLLAGHDLLVGPPSANAALCAARLPGVLGATAGMRGALMAVRPGESACWACAGSGPGPEGEGLGPAAGTVGSLMALEALKLLTGFAPPSHDAILELHLAGPTLTRVPVARRPDCPDCAG